MKKIGIIGYGHVGKAMNNLFKNAIIFDPYIEKYKDNFEEINKCFAVFVCVPTNMLDNGKCDTSVVEEVISKLNVSIIIIRSTVEIGFTNKMVAKYKKNIVFQPEYYGETVAHPFTNLNERKWISLGGRKEDIDLAIQVYQEVINSSVQIYQGKAEDVELAKYMENVFFATKVTLCNEFYDISKKLNCDYNAAREIWLADPRIGSYHTFVYKNKRGFGGKCLPKDLNSLIYQAKKNNVDCSLLEAVNNKNKKYNKL